MKKLIATFAAALISFHVHSQPADEIKEGSYPLTQGATATLADNVSVTLDNVNDSRCPEGKACVRKGGLAYSFTIRAAGSSENFVLSDEMPSYVPSSVSGISLSMDPGKPPEAGQGDGRQAHNVTLQVTRK